MKLILPDYLTQDDLLKNSSYIKYFLNTTNEKDQLTLDNLKKFFNKRSWYKFYLLDEFILRGFNLPQSSKYVYPYEKEIFCYIGISKDGHLYKNLDLKSFELQSLYNFNITSDLFFNKIPLERFKYFNPKLDLKKFSRTLQSLGFKIISLDMLQNEENDLSPKVNKSITNEDVSKIEKKNTLEKHIKSKSISNKIIITAEKLERYILDLSRDVKIQELKVLGDNVLDLIRDHQRIYLKNKDVASHLHFLNIKLEEDQRLNNLLQSDLSLNKRELFNYFKDNFDELLKRNKIRNLNNLYSLYLKLKKIHF